jgi:2-oxo-hept-3-ene-1,7-dioate hydratase
MKQNDIEQAAQALFEAETSRKQIGLLSKQHPDWTLEDAYAVQDALVKKKLASGRSIVGWKIGLTSKAMQDALKIDTPDSGILFDDMLFANGDAIPNDRFIQPRIEAEIAFVMKRDLAPENPTRDTVIGATDYVVAALEILDTRVLRLDPETKAPRTITDTVADNAANAGIVLSTKRHDPNAVDLRWVGAIVKRNGEVEETGLGAGVLDDPVTGIVWLARRLASRGQHIRAGDIVLSGSFVRPIEARPGDLLEADFGSFGQVVVRFENSQSPQDILRAKCSGLGI